MYSVNDASCPRVDRQSGRVDIPYGDSRVTLLDILDLDMLERDASYPRVDHQSGWVYIPCMSSVCVVWYDGSKLVPVTTLRCVRYPVRLAVVSRDTLYVSDRYSRTVCLVDVTQDRVTARLHPPPEVMYQRPNNIAVLEETVLVEYYGGKLVIYRHGGPTPGTVIPWPQGLNYVSGLTSDHSSFLLCDNVSRSVYVLDVSGTHTHTISMSDNRRPLDCTVVGGQLWVASPRQ